MNAWGEIADKILLATDTNAWKLTLGDSGIKIQSNSTGHQTTQNTGLPK